MYESAFTRGGFREQQVDSGALETLVEGYIQVIYTENEPQDVDEVDTGIQARYNNADTGEI